MTHISQRYRKVIKNGGSLCISIPPEAKIENGNTMKCFIENEKLIFEKVEE